MHNVFDEDFRLKYSIRSRPVFVSHPNGGLLPCNSVVLHVLKRNPLFYRFNFMRVLTVF